MHAFLIEVLKPNGWKRINVVQFRYVDAIRIAEDRLSDSHNKAVRILPITILDSPVFYREREVVQQ